MISRFLRGVSLPLLVCVLVFMPAERAAAQQSAATRGTPVDIAQFQRMILAYMEQRRFPEAARECEKLVRRHPDLAAGWTLLAECHLSNQWALRKDGRAEQAAEKAVELAGRKPGLLVNLARAKFRQRKSEEAIVLITELVDGPLMRVDRDTQASLLVMRAQLLLRGEALDPEAKKQGREDLNRALVLDPFHPSALLERAEIRMEAQDFENAKKDLDTVLQKTPGDKQAHWKLRGCYLAMGDRDKARHHMEIWRKINTLTDSIASQSAPDEEQTRQLLRELKDLNPADLNRRLQLAWHEYLAGEQASAQKEYDELAAERPGWKALEPLRVRLEQGPPTSNPEEE